MLAITTGGHLVDIWNMDQGTENGPSTISGKQPLKKLEVLQITHILLLNKCYYWWEYLRVKITL